ncbi:MAG TPA: hypothetical protein VGL66_02350 [Caulobacteraceae bacterium]|jgi:hypothetical protein
MARYFFDFDNGVSSPDATGVELANLGEAQLEASRVAGRALLAASRGLRAAQAWSITARDDRGLILFMLKLWVEDAPSTGGLQAP